MSEMNSVRQSSSRYMSLGMNLLDFGSHPAAWRMGEIEPDAYLNVQYYQDIARACERACLDAVFVADIPALMGNVRNGPVGRLEPTVLLSAIAAVTSHIGVIATLSTSYNQPFNLARRMASLDLISGGRAAWNAVTSISDAAAQNFGQDKAHQHADRYARAEEFLSVVFQLWDSWKQGAIIGDTVSGVFGNPDRIQPINHQGKHFSVRGPLNVPPSPQGRPIVVQAGASTEGKQLGARHADVIFTSQTTLRGGQDFYREMRRLAAQAGRNPDSLRIMPGLATVIGSTEQEAQARFDALHAHFDDATLTLQVAIRTGLPVEALQIDQTLPWDLVEKKSGNHMVSHGFADAMLDLARRENLTVRQLARRIQVGHRLLVGTPEQVADSLTEWFRQGAADGFNIIPDSMPSGVSVFVEEVVPLLRKRGVFRSEYSGTTLRDHLGLDMPAHAPA